LQGVFKRMLFRFIVLGAGFASHPTILQAQTAADLEFNLSKELQDVLSHWDGDEKTSLASRRAALAQRLIFLVGEKYRSGEFRENEVIKNHFNLPEDRRSVVAIFREVLKTEMGRDPLLMGLYERALGKANEFRRLQGASEQSQIARKDIVYDLQATALSLAAAGITDRSEISKWVRDESLHTHGDLGLASVAGLDIDPGHQENFAKIGTNFKIPYGDEFWLEWPIVQGPTLAPGETRIDFLKRTRVSRETGLLESLLAVNQKESETLWDVARRIIHQLSWPEGLRGLSKDEKISVLVGVLREPTDDQVAFSKNLQMNLPPKLKLGSDETETFRLGLVDQFYDSAIGLLTKPADQALSPRLKHRVDADAESDLNVDPSDSTGQRNRLAAHLNELVRTDYSLSGLKPLGTSGEIDSYFENIIRRSNIPPLVRNRTLVIEEAEKNSGKSLSPSEREQLVAANASLIRRLVERSDDMSMAFVISNVPQISRVFARAEVLHQNGLAPLERFNRLAPRLDTFFGDPPKPVTSLHESPFASATGGIQELPTASRAGRSRSSTNYLSNYADLLDFLSAYLSRRDLLDDPLALEMLRIVDIAQKNFRFPIINNESDWALASRIFRVAIGIVKVNDEFLRGQRDSWAQQINQVLGRSLDDEERADLDEFLRNVQSIVMPRMILGSSDSFRRLAIKGIQSSKRQIVGQLGLEFYEVERILGLPSTERCPPLFKSLTGR